MFTWQIHIIHGKIILKYRCKDNKRKRKTKKGSTECNKKSLLFWNGLGSWNILSYFYKGWVSIPIKFYMQYYWYVRMGRILIIWLGLVLEKSVWQYRANIGHMARIITQGWKCNILLVYEWKRSFNIVHYHSAPNCGWTKVYKYPTTDTRLSSLAGSRTWKWQFCNWSGQIWYIYKLLWIICCYRWSK